MNWIYESRTGKNRPTLLKSDIDKITKELDAEQQIYETLHKDISTTETQIKEIKKWFTEHEHFKDIIPHISLILNLIHETEIARNQKLSNEKTLISLNKTLEAQEKKLTQAKTERENLEKHLPKEIILWRSRLVEGSPVPGMREHTPSDKTKYRHFGRVFTIRKIGRTQRKCR